MYKYIVTLANIFQTHFKTFSCSTNTFPINISKHISKHFRVVQIFLSTNCVQIFHGELLIVYKYFRELDWIFKRRSTLYRGGHTERLAWVRVQARAGGVGLQILRGPARGVGPGFSGGAGGVGCSSPGAGGVGAAPLLLLSAARARVSEIPYMKIIRL